jgi:predicted nucleic-acid-binding protein
MIGLDTNVLVRYYVEDDADAETTRQREAARILVDGGRPCAVSITVVLELEWVLRGHYGFGSADVMRALRHLLSVPWVTIGDREVVERAIAGAEAGLDFADALHHATYRDCTSVVTFDDRRFARRATRLAMRPAVSVPGMPLRD